MEKLFKKINSKLNFEVLKTRKSQKGLKLSFEVDNYIVNVDCDTEIKETWWYKDEEYEWEVVNIDINKFNLKKL